MPSTDAPLAAIDIGSNSFRLELGTVSHGRYRRIDYLKETVRLGAGLDAEGLLTEDAALRGLQCLERFARRLDSLPRERVRAVATQTLREARNRDAFLQRAQGTLGYPIEVISGREEGRLIFSGVAHLQPSALPRLVIDIGGRSTELVLGRGTTPTAAESFGIGSVSLSMRHFPDGRFTEAAFRAAQVAAGAELEEALSTFAPRHWREALGASGTVGAVSQVLAAAGVSDGRITADGLRWCISQCIAAGHADRVEFEGLRPDRRAVLGGGLAILYTLLTHFGIDELLPAKGALRQGVIFDLHERLSGPQGARAGDVRAASVRALKRRFAVDAAQAARVRALALHLYAGTGERAADAALELGWACDLHEIGMLVSHHDHHRHSAYLLGHVDAPGFSQSQQRRLAELVLGQRGGMRKVEVVLANSQDYAWQLLCLRLAAIGCHARENFDEGAWSLSAQGRKAKLRIDPDWAQAHPRTLYLLQEEAAVWERSGVLELAI